MKEEVIIRDMNDIDRAAGEFLDKTAGHRLIAFFAPMGAGKTTFTAAICRKLGVSDAVCSPTFTIVNEYVAENGEPVYHFDFYRIDKISEAIDIGFEDYVYSGHLCIMEWPENVEDILPEETLKDYISVNPDSSRSVSWDDGKASS